MERVPLASRAVASACYDDASQTLELEFATGRVYRYDGVPRSVYEWLLRAPSKGTYVSRIINGRYPHRDVTSTPEPAAASGDLEEALRASLRDVEARPASEREPSR